MSGLRVSTLRGATAGSSPTLPDGVIVTGVTTATSFAGALTGNVTGNVVGNVTGDVTGNIAGTAGTFSGNVSVGGVLTFEDVTNIDSLGFGTFRSGLTVQGAGSTTTTLSVSGVTTMTGDVNLGADLNIPDAIFHIGDTDTKIRFPAADTFTVETGGSEALRVDSSRNTTFGTTSESSTSVNITASTSGSCLLSFNDTNSGQGGIRYFHSTDHMQFHTADAEKLRITSGGEVVVNGTATGSGAKFEVQSTTGSISSATLRVSAEKTTTGAVNTGSTILLAGHDGGNSRDFGSIFAGKENGTGSNYAAYLAFGTRANGSTLAERLRITSAGLVRIPDNGKFTAGAGDDLQIYHDGTDNFILTNTALKIQAPGSNSYTIHVSARTDKETIICYNNTNAPYVELYYDNSKKLETSSAGVTVTGTLNATTALTQNGNALATNGKAIAMALIFG